MKVRSSDGDDLGKIIRLDAGMLVIEKGFFFPKDYEVAISARLARPRGRGLAQREREELTLEQGQASAGRAGHAESWRGETGERRGAAPHALGGGARGAEAHP